MSGYDPEADIERLRAEVASHASDGEFVSDSEFDRRVAAESRERARAAFREAGSPDIVEQAAQVLEGAEPRDTVAALLVAGAEGWRRWLTRSTAARRRTTLVVLVAIVGGAAAAYFLSSVYLVAGTLAATASAAWMVAVSPSTSRSDRRADALGSLLLFVLTSGVVGFVAGAIEALVDAFGVGWTVTLGAAVALASGIGAAAARRSRDA